MSGVLTSVGGLLTGSAAAFDPTAFGTVVAWLKANAIVGLNDGDAVATWADSSAAAHDFVQATSGARPLYKTGIKNGLPIVRFDGTDDTMNCVIVAGQAQPTTIFTVHKTSNSANQNLLSGYSVTDVAAVIENGNKSQIYAGSVLDEGNVLADWKVASWLFNGGSSAIRTNGNSAVTGNAGSGSFVGGFVLSGYTLTAAGPFIGDVGEVLIYNGTCSDVSAVITALRNKWSI